MKKLHLLVISIIMSISLFAFAGCAAQETSPIIDLEDYNVGEQIPFYPSGQFNCEVQDGNANIVVFRIESIQAVLHAHNRINADETVKHEYHRFEIEITLSGTAPATLYGRKFILVTSIGSFSIYNGAIDIHDEGEFRGAGILEYDSRFITDISFIRISLI